MDFTYKSYKSLLLELKDLGYGFHSIDGSIPQEKSLYLRHDVDTDILGVLPLAKAEYELGVGSTWYFLFDCPLYNFLSVETMDIIRQISNWGGGSDCMLMPKGILHLMK